VRLQAPHPPATAPPNRGHLHERTQDAYDRRDHDLRTPEGNKALRLPAIPLQPSRAALALALLAPVLAGCGSSGSTARVEPDPASVAPAAAPLFVSAIVSPNASLATDATTDARELTHLSDPFASLLSTLEGEGKIHFSWAEVKPWVGERAGLLVTSLGDSQSTLAALEASLSSGLGASAGKGVLPNGKIQGTLVIDAKDTAKARSFVSALGTRSGARGASYDGVGYQAGPEGRAAAVVGHFAVIGSETALQEVIATSESGASLLRAPAYVKLTANAEPGALANVYLSPSELLGPVHAKGKESTQGILALRQVIADSQELYLSLIPSSNSIALDIDTLPAGAEPGGGGLLASSAAGAQAMGELPGESWLAAGLGNAGVSLGGDVKAISSLGSLLTSLGGSGAGASEGASTGGFGVKGVLEGVLTPLQALSSGGARTQREFLSWMSSAGIFTSGSTIVNLRAGVVIDSKNPALSHAAVARLGALLNKAGGSTQPVSIPGTDAAISARVKGLPVELDIASGQSGGQPKFVIGLGEASVLDALHPASTLSSTATSSIAKTLGDGAQPSLTIDFPTLITLLEGVGLGDDPSLSTAMPYLRSLSTLTGGSRSLGGGIERYRLLLGLQQQSSAAG